MSPRVSIIVVNFKNLKDTFQCLNALSAKVAFRGEKCQIIVVDNGSGNESDNKLKLFFPNVTNLALQRNLGFAGANNVGILYALRNKADYVFLLNNDAFVDQNTIQRLLEVFSQDPTIGIVGATVLDYDNPKIIDNMGAKISFSTGNSKFVANGDLYRESRENTDVDYVSGAAMMIKREVIERVGLLPEYYFLYGEEKDYCMRAKEKGYRIVSAARATIIHKTSSTMKKYLGLKNYYFHRNRFIFLRLHAKPYQFIFAILHSALMIFPFYLVKYLIRERSRFHDGLEELFNFMLGVFDGIRFKTGCTKEVN